MMTPVSTVEMSMTESKGMKHYSNSKTDLSGGKVRLNTGINEYVSFVIWDGEMLTV